MKYHSGSSILGGFMRSNFSPGLAGHSATNIERTPTTAIARQTSASKTLGKNGTSSSDSSLFSLEWLCNAMPPNHEEVKRHQENKQPRDQQNVTGEEPPECISIVSPPENAR